MTRPPLRLVCGLLTALSAVPHVAVVAAPVAEETRQPMRRPASRRARRASRRREESPAIAPQDPAADPVPVPAPVSVACRRLSSMVSPAACRAAVSAVQSVRAFDARVRPLR